MKPKKLALIFIILECLIYALFIFNLTPYSEYLKYLGVILCFAFTFANHQNWSNRSLLYRVALFFTLVADLFLLLLDDYYLIGLLAFIITQLCYYRLLFLNHTKKQVRYSAICRMILFVIGGLVLMVLRIGEPITFAALFYFINLLVNCIDSSVLAIRKECSWLLPVGLLLFICCDICVALFNVLETSAPLYNYVAFGMWFFYLPSQVLISLSSQSTRI